MQNVLVFFGPMTCFLSFVLSNLMIKRVYLLCSELLWAASQNKDGWSRSCFRSSVRTTTSSPWSFLARKRRWWGPRLVSNWWRCAWFNCDWPEPEKSTCSLGEAEEGAELGDPPNVPVQVDIFFKTSNFFFSFSILQFFTSILNIAQEGMYLWMGNLML